MLFMFYRFAKGDEVLLRDALKTYGAANNMAVNPQYRLLDALGGMMIQTISDRYWTEKRVRVHQKMVIPSFGMISPC